MTDPADLYAPFRPRWARWVSLCLGLLTLLGGAALLIVMPLKGLPLDPADIVGIVSLTALVVWFCYRQTTVKAIATAQGLRVRNLVVVRDLSWAQIITVRFGDRPWAALDLTEGDTLSVMAIQAADGDVGRREARRLATLVALHEPRD